MKRIILSVFILSTLFYIVPEQEAKDKRTATIVENIEVHEEQISNRSGVRTAESIAEVSPITKYDDELVEYIKSKEKFKDTAYKLDGESSWTIGYGTHNSSIYEGMTITEEEADKMMRIELDGINEYVLKYMTYQSEELTQGQLNALVSFAYNGGVGMLQQLTGYKTRTLEEIAEHFTAYTSKNPKFKKGLLDRRQEELRMYLGGEENV